VGVIVISTTCNFLCDHCSVRNSAYDRYKLPREIMIKFIDELSKIPTAKLIAFTGGEPTLFLNDLLYGIEYAHKKGFITRLVTNGWWARTYESASKYIKMFKSHGLDEINTSYDDYHAKFAKIDNIANLIKVALEEGLRVALGVITIEENYYNADRVKEEISKRLSMTVEELEKRVFFIEDQPAPVGVASTLYSKEKDRFVANRPKLDVGCPNIGSILTLLPNGDVKACCGHPIFQSMNDPFLLGNINKEDLATMVKYAQSRLFYWALRFLGPKRLLERIGVKGEYTHLCHACEVIIKNEEYSKKIANYLKTHAIEVFINDILLSDNIARLEEVAIQTGVIDKLKKIYNI